VCIISIAAARQAANCQVTVTLSIANIMPACRSPIAVSARVWTDDAARRKSACSAAIRFKTKPQIGAGADPRALKAAVAPGVC